MSVNYTARLGYGYIVTKSEYSWLSKEQMEEFTNHDFTIRLDGYSGNTNYFFGLSVFAMEPGEYCNVPNDRHSLYAYEDCIEMINDFKSFFPHIKDHPRDYVLFCVD